MTVLLAASVPPKHVRRIRIFLKPYNYGIMRSRIVRVNTLRMNQSLECIIPFHAFCPLSEKNKISEIEIAY